METLSIIYCVILATIDFHLGSTVYTWKGCMIWSINNVIDLMLYIEEFAMIRPLGIDE